MDTNNTETPVGPITEVLKDAFSTHKIPLESNFADLIDVADCGRKAVGANPGQTLGTGAGLQLDNESKLAVLSLSGGGISVSAAGVGVSLEANKGLSVSASGLAVCPGNGINLGATGVGVTPQSSGGINVSAAGVGVSLEANKGLSVSANGLAVKSGSGINLTSAGVGVTPQSSGGINVSAAGVGVSLEANKGLSVSANGLAVKSGSGINLTSAGVGVTVEASKGLTVGANGVAVQAGVGIKVDSSGVGVDFGTSLNVVSGKLEVADSFAAPTGVLAAGIDFNTVVPPAYRVGVYAIPNGSAYPSRPATGDGLAGNAFLMMFSHGSSNSNDVTQIYFNAVGGMWLRAKHDGAAAFTGWGRINAVQADTAKGITVADNVVGVNYGSSLTVTSNKLEVSNNIFARKQITGSSNSSSVVWKRLARIDPAQRFAYAQFQVLAWGTTTQYKQRFIVTVCSDGDVHYNNFHSYSLSISNAVRRPTSNYGINNIRIGRDWSGNTWLDVEITHTNEVVNLMIDYSLADIGGVTLYPFDGAGQVVSQVGIISTASNGAIQG